MSEELILVINPGSTSTKLALFRGESCEAEEAVPAPASGGALWDQLEGRLVSVNEFLKREY